MNEPGHKGFEAAVEAIYAAAPDPSLWPRALQAIADVFEDIGANLLWRRDDGQFGVVVSPSLHAASQEYEQGWGRQDIRASRGADQLYWLRTDALTDRHVVTREEIETHPFYTQFLARHGLKWTASTGVSPDPHVMVGISIQRSVGKPEYSDTELEMLARIGRYAEKALRLSIGLFDAELSNLGLRDALARIGIGIFALDSLGRVVFANPAGERMLGDGLAIANDRLLLGTAPGQETPNETIMQMVRGGPPDLARDPKPILIERQKSERPLAVYVLPVTSTRNEAAEFLTHTRALVLVIDPGSEPADPALVRDVLGLTLGEARVAALVGAGLPPREAAERLGITEETARTTLKRIFSKTGISRQSELTALLTRLILR